MLAWAHASETGRQAMEILGRKLNSRSKAARAGVLVIFVLKVTLSKPLILHGNRSQS
jgi:hypothetical protein